jgi:hypothetical protein
MHLTEVPVRTPNIKLWQTFLGLLVVTSLASCGGGGSKGGGCGDASCVEAGPGGPDGPATTPDQAAPAPDQAAPTVDAQSIDQMAMDQAPATPDGGADADAADDAAADKPSDLPWGPEVQKRDTLVKTDVTPEKRDATPDQLVKRDGRDAAPDAGDVAADLPPKEDTSPKEDTPPQLDTQSLDTESLDTGFADTDPTLPVVVPNKLVYAPGEALTATWNNGSTSGDPWISIYHVGAPNGDYGNWARTSKKASGTVSLIVPTAPGTYELRMFLDDSTPYKLLATSLPFVVQ